MPMKEGDVDSGEVTGEKSNELREFLTKHKSDNERVEALRSAKKDIHHQSVEDLSEVVPEPMAQALVDQAKVVHVEEDPSIEVDHDLHSYKDAEVPRSNVEEEAAKPAFEGEVMETKADEKENSQGSEYDEPPEFETGVLNDLGPEEMLHVHVLQDQAYAFVCGELNDEDEDDCCSQKSSSTISTHGSFGLLKAALFDEMSVLSNRKKAKKRRGGRRLAKATADDECIDDALEDEICAYSGVLNDEDDECRSQKSASSFGRLKAVRKRRGGKRAPNDFTESVDAMPEYEVCAYGGELNDEDEDDCRSQKSSSTISTHGSFGLLKAALFDDMSKMSNRKKAKKKRGGKRLAKAAAESVDFDDECIDDALEDEICAYSAALNDEDEDSKDEQSPKRNRGRRGRMKAQNFLPKVVLITEDESNRTMKTEEDDLSDDDDSPSNEDARIDRNKSTDAFEKQQRTLRAEAEAKLQLHQEVSHSIQEQRVSFSTVEIRHYERIIGDHPSCSRGVPMGIGWEHDIEQTQRLSVDEHKRDLESPSNAQYSSVTRLSRHERADLLLELGFDLVELAQAVRRNEKTKRRRMQTVHNLHLQKIEEMAESAARKIKNVARGKRMTPCDEWTASMNK